MITNIIIGLLVLLLVVINYPTKKKQRGNRDLNPMSWSEYFRNGNWYHKIEV